MEHTFPTVCNQLFHKIDYIFYCWDRLVDMDTRRQFSSMSMSEKRDRLMLLAKKLKMRKRKLMKRKLVKLGNLVKEETSNTENRDTKPKMKLNGHLYKKMFQKAGQKQKMMLNGLLFPEPK